MKRKSIPKKLRFEVLKRDQFTCQYCGAKAPDILLHIDHIEPVSKGGTTDLLNLITSCRECNLGKGKRRLSDDTAILKQRKQLDELAAWKEQLDMMLLWRREMVDEQQRLTEYLSNRWSTVCKGYSLNSRGLQSLRRLLRRFSFTEIEEAMEIAGDHYLMYEPDKEKPTQESVEVAWSKVPGICWNRKQERIDPDGARLNHIRALIHSRGFYVNEGVASDLLKAVHAKGIPIEEIEQWSRRCRNWTEWREKMGRWLATSG